MKKMIYWMVGGPIYRWFFAAKSGRVFLGFIIIGTVGTLVLGPQQPISTINTSDNKGARAVNPFSEGQTLKLMKKEKMPDTWEAEVYFLVKEDAKAEAEECVRHYSGSFKSVYCYGFSSQEAYDFSEIQASGGMKKQCYTVSAYKNLNGRSGGAPDNRQMLQFHKCPRRIPANNR